MVVHTIRLAGRGEIELSPEARVALGRAEVIIAVDVNTQREFTLYGTPSFEETVQIGRDAALDTVRVELDDGDDQLRKLVSLVQAIKGR